MHVMLQCDGGRQARGSQFGSLMSGVGCKLWQNLVAVEGGLER